MPAKETITRDQIIESAFDIVRSEGYKTLSARNIAKKMRCSTMPIYSQFENMESLEAEVARKSMELLLKYQLKDGADSTPLSISEGMLKFALDERELYKVMMLNDDPSQEKIRREMKEQASRELDLVFRNRHEGDAERYVSEKGKLRKILIYTQGLIVSFLFEGIDIDVGELEILLQDYHTSLY